MFLMRSERKFISLLVNNMSSLFYSAKELIFACKTIKNLYIFFEKFSSSKNQKSTSEAWKLGVIKAFDSTKMRREKLRLFEQFIFNHYLPFPIFSFLYQTFGHLTTYRLSLFIEFMIFRVNSGIFFLANSNFKLTLNLVLLMEFRVSVNFYSSEHCQIRSFSRGLFNFHTIFFLSFFITIEFLCLQFLSAAL